MGKEANGVGVKAAEGLWQHESLSLLAEVKMPQRTLGSKKTNSFLFETPDKGEGRRDTLLPPLAPPLHQSIFTRTQMRIAPILPTSLKHGTIPSFSPRYSWEKLMDLNCITVEAARSRALWGGGSKPGGG